MSAMAEWHARTWLNAGRTVEEIKGALAKEYRALEEAKKNTGIGGEDGFGWVRAAHWSRTAIKVFEAALAERGG